MSLGCCYLEAVVDPVSVIRSDPDLAFGYQFLRFPKNAENVSDMYVRQSGLRWPRCLSAGTSIINLTSGDFTFVL